MEKGYLTAIQNARILEIQQKNMDLGPAPVVNLGQDKAWVAMRQIVERLAREERGEARAA